MGDSFVFHNGWDVINGRGIPWSSGARIPQLRATSRGFFVPRIKGSRFRDVLDGLSNTICMGEITTDLGDNDVRTRPAQGGGNRFGADLRSNIQACSGWKDARRPQFWDSGAATLVGTAEQRRGFKWAGGQPLYTAGYTIFPPNREICVDGGAQRAGIYTFGSRHQGGCHVLMGDGAVKFITDSIEAGGANSRSTVVYWHSDGGGDASIAWGSASNFGLWGALGTQASREVINQEF